jgi:YidC/Oxa1 family membrane protein insertase
MLELYRIIFSQPIFNFLVWLYDVIPGHDIGIAIVLLTIIIKLLLYPLSKKSLESQKAMQTLQPKLKEIQEKYKDDKQAQTKAIMELYAREKVSPFSSCLPLLIQFPFLIALYQSLMAGLKSQKMEMLYPFVKNPETINVVSFGFLDLSKPNFALAILAGAAQFWQAKMLSTSQPPKKAGEGAKDEGMMAIMNKQMLYFMPLMTVFIGMSLPGGLTLYWLVMTLLTVLQQWWSFRNNKQSSPKPIANSQ